MIRKKPPIKPVSFKKQLLWFVGIYAISVLAYARISVIMHFYSKVFIENI